METIDQLETQARHIANKAATDPIKSLQKWTETAESLPLQKKKILKKNNQAGEVTPEDIQESAFIEQEAYAAAGYVQDQLKVFHLTTPFLYGLCVCVCVFFI